MADRRPGLRRLVVVKVGSSTLVDAEGRPRLHVFARIAGECADLVLSGTPVVVVSSGAVALGIGELGKTIRPRALGDLQARLSEIKSKDIPALNGRLKQAGLGQVTLPGWMPPRVP